MRKSISTEHPARYICIVCEDCGTEIRLDRQDLGKRVNCCRGITWSLKRVKLCDELGDLTTPEEVPA